VSGPAGAPAPLGPDELEALWREAWLQARRLCGGTLSRLRRGLGGLYEADDFQQDAFLAFRALALRWAAQSPRPPVGELWSAWRRALWHGGSAICRRPPQRLWRRPLDRPLDLEALLDGGSFAPAEASLLRAVYAALVQWDDAEARLVGEEARAAARTLLEDALPALPARQRQLLRWALLDGLDLGEIALRLGIGRAASGQRLRRALASLRRAIARRRSLREEIEA